MSLLKNLKLVIAVFTVLLILVLIRHSNQNVFRERVETAVEITKNQSNLITPDQLLNQTTPYLLIDLGNKPGSGSFQYPHAIQIPFEKLLDYTNRKVLKEARGKVILFSEDISLASKAWVILNQLGYKNVLILASAENQEALKYKFQPDTTARLEEEPTE